jgi:hypothetical protein
MHLVHSTMPAILALRRHLPTQSLPVKVWLHLESEREYTTAVQNAIAESTAVIRIFLVSLAWKGVSETAADPFRMETSSEMSEIASSDSKIW